MSNFEKSFQKALKAAGNGASAKTSLKEAARGHNVPNSPGDTSEKADELVMYLDNDGALYHRFTTPIMEKLKTKMREGKYVHAYAPKAWIYLVDAASQKYKKEIHGAGGSGTHAFAASVRREAADYISDRFLRQVQGGEHDRPEAT